MDPNAHGISSSDIDIVENSAKELARQGALDVMDLLNIVDRLNVAGRKSAGKDLYRLWIDHTASPYLYVACFNLAVILAADGEYPQAESMNRKALDIKPDFIQARLNLGNNLEQLGRIEEGLEQWRSVLTNGSIGDADNKALHLHALNNLGRLLETKRDLRESLCMLEKSLELDPTQLDVLLHLGHLRQKQCIWPLNMLRQANTKDDAARGCSPLALLAATNDPELQLAAAKWFVDYKFSADNQRLAPIGGYRHKKIRIGYLSSDFCLHAVSLLTAELYELHDRERFEVYGFCWSREDGSYLRTRVIKAMDHFTRIGGMTDRKAADCIRANEIDILIDLQGLTSGARPLILSYRPAPVQMTYLGFPGATGLPWIDYVIADKYLIPEESSQFFTEKPLYLPDCFQVSDSKRPIGTRPLRIENHLPEDAFVFCSFNNNYKFTQELFLVWMRILRRVPNSVLWLLADNEWARENLCRAAKKQGIHKERLISASRVAPADYLARYQLADLFLDTFPFNGGTTANDALFMGLPLLTLSGCTFASRMAGSLLTNLGLPELIAANFKGYEEKAVRLANRPADLKVLKDRLDENRASGIVFNTAIFVKAYENKLAGVLEEVKSNTAEIDAKTDVDEIKVVGSDDSCEPVAANSLIEVSSPLPDTSQLASSLETESCSLVAEQPAPPHLPAKKRASKGGGKSNLPLVSILIPTHNRPDYFELALKSALAQDYANIEIIVSDNSDDELTSERLERYLGENPYIHYSRVPNYSAIDNFNNCLDLAEGEYINYLMDDDLFHPEKIKKMMAYMLTQPNIGLVTSSRQLIDGDGKYLNPIPGKERIFNTETLIHGFSLGDSILTKGMNIIGEPTTVLFRRANIGERFGVFLEKEYVTLSGVATWLSVLLQQDCIYLPEPLSFFRIHGGQDGRSDTIKIKAHVEWLQLFCDAYQRNNFSLNRHGTHELLTSKLVTSMWLLSSEHEKIKYGAYELEKIHSVIRQATAILLTK